LINSLNKTKVLSFFSAVGELILELPIDLSICALLAGPNKFTGFNSWSEVDIAKTALTANVGVGGAPYYDLNLTEDANVFRVAALDPGDYTIVNIVFTEGRVVVDGDVLYLKFDSCAATFNLGNCRKL